MTKLTGWQLSLMGFYRYSHLSLLSRGLARSSNKLKRYIYYHDNYSQQTWQDSDIPCGAQKQGKVVTHREGCPCINSNSPLIIC